MGEGLGGRGGREKEGDSTLTFEQPISISRPVYKYYIDSCIL